MQGEIGVKMSLEYDPRAGNVQHFSKSKSSCCNEAGLSTDEIKGKHTHTHTTISLISQFAFIKTEAFPIFFLWCFVIGWLPGAVADSRHSSGCPVGPLIFHQPIDLELKAWGRGWRGSPSVLWQPAGAWLGLFPASADCFSFSQVAELCRSREGEVECRRHLGEHVTATARVGGYNGIGDLWLITF